MWKKARSLVLDTALNRAIPAVKTIITMTMTLPLLPSAQIPEGIQVSFWLFNFVNELKNKYIFIFQQGYPIIFQPTRTRSGYSSSHCTIFGLHTNILD